MADFGIFGATAATTYQQTTTNDAAPLDPTELEKVVDGGIVRARAITVQVITNDIRIAFNVEPTQDAGTKLGYEYAAGDVFTVTGYSNIRAIQVISAAAGAHGVLNITVFF